MRGAFYETKPDEPDYCLYPEFIEVTRELEKLVADYKHYNSEYCARQIANYICDEMEGGEDGQ